MQREKFVRNSSHVNIGEIGRENTDISSDRINFASSTFAWVMENGKQYNQHLLQELIKKYGEAEGKRQFAVMKEEANKRLEEIQNMNMEPECDVKSSGLRR